MSIFAIHAPGGELTALVVGPAEEATPVGVVSLPGHLVTAVEAPDIPHDLDDEASQRRVLEVLRRSRVDVGPPVRLVPRGEEHERP
jgi:hypothetical protein